MTIISHLRSYRFFEIAIFDVISSMLLLAFLFGICWNTYYSDLNINNFIIAGIVLAVPVGIIGHLVFGINTQLNYKLGLSHKPKRT